MNLERINRVYLIGIGGIGMSALARYFNLLNLDVAGYDRTTSDITVALEQDGIRINYSDETLAIPESYSDPERSSEILVIYTPAVPTSSVQLNYFRNNGFRVYKRSEVLGEISKGFKTIAVGGSHGKTTISAMIAEILRLSELGCSAFLGGISKSIDSNLVLNPDSSWAVMEADEFDKSFLHLHPDLAIVSSIDPDHLDIYGDQDHLRETFSAFIDRLPNGGTAVVKDVLDNIKPSGKSITWRNYSLESHADYYAVNIKEDGLCYRFDLATPVGIIEACKISVPGWINIENAVGAAAICIEAGVAGNDIRTGLESFTGIRRRFDIRINKAGLCYIDDYAHHPIEIRSLVDSIEKMFPGKKITGIFQPHLYSRTRDFAGDFARELSRLDEVILLDIYPAREEPIEGVTSGLIFEKLIGKKELLSREDLLERFGPELPDVVLTIGAGDIDRLVEPLERRLLEYAS